MNSFLEPSHHERNTNNLARLALRAIVLLEQGAPAAALDDLTTAMHGPGPRAAAPASSEPWLERATRIVDSIRRLARSSWSREAADAVLQAVVHRGAPLVWLTDVDLRVRYALAVGTVPLDPYDSLLGSDLFEYFGARDSGHPVVTAHLDAVEGRAVDFSLPHGGTEIPLRVEPVRDAAGEVVGCLVQTRTEDVLADAERLRVTGAALEQVTSAVLVTRKNGEVIWFNRAFAQLTGCDTREVLAQTARTLKPSAHDNELLHTLWDRIEDRNEWKGEIVSRSESGSLYTRVTISPVTDANGSVTHFVSVLDDLSRQRLVEDQLEHSQRLETVGRLAGWIAHDFNNLLTTILGYTDLILADGVENDGLRADLEEIRRAGHSATALTRQILAFNKRQVRMAQPVELTDTLGSLKRTLGRLLGEDIEVVVRSEVERSVAHFDPGQIEQVLLALAVRAREAMPRGGVFLVELKEPELALSRPAHDAGSYVVVSIHDTGNPIDPAELPRVFEPASRSEREGREPGLALDAIATIIHHGGGHIFAHSQSSVGTTFEIFLPRAETALSPQAPKEDPKLQRRSTSESVLLVEDARDVRALARRVLTERGYRVLEAENGAEALLVSSTHQGPISLLVTDIVMPLMNGPEAARRLQALRPEMRVLFMSGYTSEVLSEHGLDDLSRPFLKKPFTPQDLLVGVRGALDA